MVSTLAGSGVFSVWGVSDGLGAAASFASSLDVSVIDTAQGSFLVADFSSNLIRSVTSAGE